MRKHLKKPSFRKKPELMEARAVDHLFSLVYEDLRKIASSVHRNEQDRSLNSTALVHEAWLKLRDSSPAFGEVTKEHFKAIAARAMRQILVDQARYRCAQKRLAPAGELWVIELQDAEIKVDEEFLALDAALDELKALNPRQAAMVESRFFGGLTVADTAALLGVSESAVERDWRAARAWLKARVNRG